MIYHQIANSVPLIPIPQLQTIPDTLRDLGIGSPQPFHSQWPSECGPEVPRTLHWQNKGLHSWPCAEYMPGCCIGFIAREFLYPDFPGLENLPWFFLPMVAGWPTPGKFWFKKWIMIPDSNGDLKKCAKAPCPDTQYNTHAAGNVLGRYCRNRPRLPMSKKMCKSIWIAQTQSSSGKPAGLGKKHMKSIEGWSHDT